MRSTSQRTFKRLRALVPRPIKRLGLRFYVRWLMRNGPGPTDKPRISFAGVLPSEGSFIRGGKVKLTHLRDRFGEYARGFNIIYLVSSTLPAGADIWVSEAKHAGIKVIWNQNGVGYPAWTPKWKEHNASMLPIQDSDFIIYQSVFSKTGTDRWVAAARSEYAVVPNCVDMELFKPPATPPPTKLLRLLVMGTHMTPEKVFVPLEATRLLLDRGINVSLDIIGPAEWQDAERDIATKITTLRLQKHVTRHGRFLQDKAPDLYRQAHIFVHLKDMDPCPTAVIEAQACGLPVIGSNSGGMPELVSKNSGILLDVPSSWDRLHYPSADAVADAVQTIAPQWPLWSTRTREHAVAHFGVPNWLDAHADIFTRVLAGQ